MTERMSKEEFVERFVKRMLECVGSRKTFSDGSSIETYAKETAPTYYDEQYAEDPNETPEDCAETDISYWEP